ncbi:MAG TPA: HIT family protein [Thermoanaerobaculia bacterium]|jgi:diadenosine tetraphosphate (Ap4A) HIT family hydrolase
MCVLCDDPGATGDVVYEDDETAVVLHADWAVRGHAMVIARRHVENASQLEEAEWLQLARVWQRTERVLLELTRADRAIVMKLGIQTPHLHVHIYPVPAAASRGDVFDAIDAKTSVPRDERFVEACRQALNP